jgi:hypothetical protein
LDFGATIENMAHLFTVLGIDANSAFGSILGGLTSIGSSVSSLTALGGEGGLGGVFGGLGDLFGGASEAAGGGIFGAISGIAAVAGPIGAIAGPAIQGIGAVVGALFKSEAEKIASDVERDFGVEISEGLAKAIEATADEFSVGRREATLLNLGDIIGEAGGVAGAGGLGNVTAQVGDLFSAIALGAVPAQEGIAEVGEAFGLIASEVVKAGQVADAEFINMITRARELGLEVPEIAAFVAEQLSMAATGIGRVVGGIEIVTAEDAQAQATIFAGAFFATVEEVGLLEAVDAFEPAFKELKEQIQAFGGDVNLGGVGRLFQIAGQEEFRPLLEGVQGLDEALQGLSNTGFLTADSFQAFQQQAGTAFEQFASTNGTSLE